MSTTTRHKGRSIGNSRSRRSSHRGVGRSASTAVSKTLTSALDKTKDVAQGLKEKVAAVLPTVGQFITGSIDLGFDSLRDLYVQELQDLYSAENQLLKALPKMAEAASSKDLRSAFQAHLKETEGQVERLKKVFEGLGMPPKKRTCKAMEGLIAEGSEWMGEHATPGVMDAGLIAAAQRVEHYEIAGYGCIRTYAQLLGYDKAVTLLQQTLDEEAAADKKLTQLSKRINVQAESDDEVADGQKNTRSLGRRAGPRTSSNGKRKVPR